MTRPATVAVVLNYRTPREAIGAVRSLLSSSAPFASIIVVDNASDDGSADLLARDLPDIELIVAAANGGFSAGCNVGIREALRRGAARVLLLNSDVTVPPDAVARWSARSMQIRRSALSGRCSCRARILAGSNRSGSGTRLRWAGCATTLSARAATR